MGKDWVAALHSPQYLCSLPAYPIACSKTLPILSSPPLPLQYFPLLLPSSLPVPRLELASLPATFPDRIETDASLLSFASFIAHPATNILLCQLLLC